MLRIVLISLGLSITSILAAQICGTPQEPLLARIAANKKVMMTGQRNAIKYIPVTFHLVADANGNGRVSEEGVLSQLANMNNQYADQDIKYFIDRLNYFNNDAVYNAPASNPAKIQMRIKKDNNSINIYITNTADSGHSPPGATTLAYYDPQDDWVVSRKDQINAGSSTLAHEVGHFFSLLHTHAGWDCYPYRFPDYTNPVNVDYTKECDGGGGSELIELHDRSNCEDAGDMICDTPEDYNLGLFYQDDCAQNFTIMDKNGEVIKPMTNNYMSYYSDCATHEFTQTQKNLINTDYFSVQRNYIRTGHVPVTTPVVDPVTYIYPINGIESNGPTNILLDWEPVAGANKYLVIYDRFASFTNNPVKTIVTNTEFLITNTLLTGITYYWKVWPYNESMTGAGYSATQNFKVGTGVGVNEIREINEYSISPNPTSGKFASLLTLTSTKAFSAHMEVTNVSGQVLIENDLDIPSGISQYPVNTVDLSAGIYFVTLQSDKGRLVERLLISE